MPSITIISDAATFEADAVLHGESLLVDARDFAAATGWTLEPEGLCQGDTCVSLKSHLGVTGDGRIDAERVAALIDRSVVVDPAERIVAYGPTPSAITEQLESRHAADFTLPTLDGEQFTFSTIGRKKKLLVTWASW